jgi:hypothetical protein
LPIAKLSKILHTSALAYFSAIHAGNHARTSSLAADMSFATHCLTWFMTGWTIQDSSLDIHIVGIKSYWRFRLHADQDHVFLVIGASSGIGLSTAVALAGICGGYHLQAIEEGQAQYFANDRLKQMAGV